MSEQSDDTPHIRMVIDRDHAELCIHTPNEKINKLSRKAFLELADHLAVLRSKADQIKTVLIYSDKPGMFLAGADIEEIKAMKTREEAMDLVEKAQGVFQELAELPQTTLVAIDGVCLGGGLELSLACNYRIASDNPATSIGLPEIQLGVLPGAGGTQRLPRLIGLENALNIILKARPVDARKALKIGIVSDVVPQENLLEFCRNLLKERKFSRYELKESFGQWLKESTPIRKMIFSSARKSVLKETKGRYPAPLKALEVIERTFHQTEIKEGLKIEAEGFVELALTDVSKNLIHIFFTDEAQKKNRGVAAGEATSFKPVKIDRVGVLGAGVMGGGIAAVSASKGLFVRLKDVQHESILTGLKTAQDLFSKELKRGKIDRAEYLKRTHRITSSLQWTGFEHVPFVIEAVVENLEIKKKVIQELEVHLPSTSIIATNTSSLSVTEISKASKYPERVTGMHFFNPVPKMPLVEVVRGENSSAEAVAQTVAFAKQLGKKIIVVKDRPGFLINRILMPFLIECGHLKHEGYGIRLIDRAAVDFGMPMGPFRLLDEIGLDTGAKVAKVIASAFPHMKVLPLIDEMVEKGYLGKKNKKGFYQYDASGKELGVSPEFDKEGKVAEVSYLQDRLILPMVTEAVMALDEGIVATVPELDYGLIMGIGFPPYRGGLLKWVSSVGEDKILDRMNELYQKTEGRLIVPESLKARVSSKMKFYHDPS